MGRRSRGSAGPTGVLWVDKPAGPTSAEVCDFLRWVLRTRAVGHCGTLDPAATGLLVCCVGAATRLVPLLVDDDKTYRATFVLGASTTTADAQGDVVAEAAVEDEVWAQTPDAVQALLGEHQLSPPAFSAVKIDGERAHARARRGEVVELPPRPMRVFEVEQVEPGPRSGGRAEISAVLRVSKGSFIRSLAELLGRRLGVPCHLGRLHRLASGASRLGERGLSGFDVTPLPPRPDGKPRHRLRLRGAEPDREGQAAAVLTALVSPVEVLGRPSLDLSQVAQGDDLARRLGHGQPIEASHPGLAGAPRDQPLVLTRGESLVVTRWDGSGDSAVLRIDRTIVPLTTGDGLPP